MQAELYPALQPYFAKAIVSLVVAGLGGLMLWPIKYARREWKSIKEAVASTHAELITQRQNHLTHIQENGEQQTKILTKVVDILEGLRLDTQSQTGFIQGLALSPMRARAQSRVKK